MKKLLSILLSLILVTTSVVTAFAVKDSELIKLKKTIRKERYSNDVKLEDIEITMYKKIDDKFAVFEYEHFMSDCMMYYIYMGKYYYKVPGSGDFAYLYDGKKIYEIKDAYENDVINNKQLDKIAKVLENMKVANFTVKAGDDIPISDEFDIKNPKIKKVNVSKKNVVKIGKYGSLSALRKGETTITAFSKSGKKYTCKVKVTSNPKLKSNSIKVKQNKTAKVEIIGKASEVKTKYKNTEYAKVVYEDYNSIEIKGLKKGKTTIDLVVNKVINLKLNVTVV